MLSLVVNVETSSLDTNGLVKQFRNNKNASQVYEDPKYDKFCFIHMSNVFII